MAETKFICCDEVGRGALAFDVVAAAVILPDDVDWSKIKDSKKIKSHKTRCELSNYIKENAISFGFGSVGPEEIDRDNILHSTMKAMHAAIRDAINMHGDDNCKYKILVDGNYFHPPYTNIEHECIVKGDDKVVGISAASILAKAYRDCDIIKITENDEDLKKYKFSTNMGYGTSAHFAAIKEYGPLPKYHRMTFLSRCLDQSVSSAS